MKKLLETSLGNWSETVFVYEGKRIMDINNLPDILEKECNPYQTKDDEGIIVYMSKKEYESIKKIINSL